MKTITGELKSGTTAPAPAIERCIPDGAPSGVGLALGATFDWRADCVRWIRQTTQV
ncbi:MAG: hypothetical protein O2923_07480 [Verrucomicrobia bacterium]|nr:hypothetical protein [Verrucomicrobiota bacterium]MDA1086974.1 hypothetical protein [Verrucomicrobiota bacterium]